MGIRINSDGYILDANGKVQDPNQKDAAQWKAYIQAEWDKNKQTHEGEATPPKDQTIVVVKKGDCLWTIAEEAGTADPRKTAYQINEQFADNPDLIQPGEVVFVDQSVKYAHGDTRDNTDVFADQTAVHTPTAGGNQTEVRGDVSNYLDTIPAKEIGAPIIGPPDQTSQDGADARTQHEYTVQNILLYPSWDGNSEQGQAGRKIVAEEYLKDFPVTASASQPKNRQDAFYDLKVSVGVMKRSTDTDGNPEYVDKTREEIQADLAKGGLKGDELTKTVDNRVALQKNINEGYNAVKAA